MVEQCSEAARIVGSEIDAVLALELKGDNAILIDDGHYNFALIKRKRNFIAHVLRVGRSGCQHYEHLGRIEERIFNGVVPMRAGFDVKLIDPDAGSCSLEVSRKTQGELRILAAVTDKRRA
jgi:hypothetical protein